MLNIVLYQPEIPPNTGNIIRLSANSGGKLHLIEPLGFEIDDKRLRRAGLDYGEWKDISVHSDWKTFIETVAPKRIFAISTKGKRYHHEADYAPDDWVVFGPETRGLPDEVLNNLPSTDILRIPMIAGSRSMNLSNAAAVIIYEAWRQNSFVNSI